MTLKPDIEKRITQSSIKFKTSALLKTQENEMIDTEKKCCKDKTIYDQQNTQDHSNLIKKITCFFKKNSNRDFAKEYTKMVNKHMKDALHYSH